MALTTEHVRAPETSSPARPEPPATSTRAVLSWVAVVIALAATVVFAFAVVRSDGGERQPVLVGLPDAKDHPQYNPPEVVAAVGAVISDAKDHPRYNPPEVVSAVGPVVSDAKDHPQYNPPEVVSAVGPVISDAKDHPRYRSTGIVVGDDGS